MAAASSTGQGPPAPLRPAVDPWEAAATAARPRASGGGVGALDLLWRAPISPLRSLLLLLPLRSWPVAATGGALRWFRVAAREEVASDLDLASTTISTPTRESSMTVTRPVALPLMLAWASFLPPWLDLVLVLVLLTRPRRFLSRASPVTNPTTSNPNACTPFFLICRKDGHLTAECTAKYPPPVVKHYGRGLPGCGFFGLEGGGEAVVAAPKIHNAAVITILEGEGSMERLSEELCEWGAEDWDWQLEQITEAEFGTVFPSKESLRMVSKSASFTLPIHQLVISVKKATNVDRSFGALVEA